MHPIGQRATDENKPPRSILSPLVNPVSPTRSIAPSLKLSPPSFQPPATSQLILVNKEIRSPGSLAVNPILGRDRSPHRLILLLFSVSSSCMCHQTSDRGLSAWPGWPGWLLARPLCDRGTFDVARAYLTDPAVAPTETLQSCRWYVLKLPHTTLSIVNELDSGANPKPATT